jgi:hypothetical protein
MTLLTLTNKLKLPPSLAWCEARPGQYHTKGNVAHLVTLPANSCCVTARCTCWRSITRRSEHASCVERHQNTIESYFSKQQQPSATASGLHNDDMATHSPGSKLCIN